MTTTSGIDPSVPPSGDCCVECLTGDGPGGWFNLDGVELAPPAHRPLDQPKPGPTGKVPEDWKEHLH